MKSPLCQLADVAIALHARDAKSIISPPPLTAISTLSTGTTVTSLRSNSPLTPPSIRARRYAICIEREPPPDNRLFDIAGALLCKQKVLQQQHSQQQQQLPIVRALPPLRYNVNPTSFRQQSTGLYRANLRRVATVAATVVRGASTNDTVTTMATTSTVGATIASKKMKMDDEKNEVVKSQVSPQTRQQHVVEAEKIKTSEIQIKIKSVEQLQQEQNFELLIKASEQRQKQLKEEEIVEQQVVAETAENQKETPQINQTENDGKNEEIINVIDLTDSDDDYTNEETTEKLTSQTLRNHRRRKRHHRHHRRHRRRQALKTGGNAEENQQNEEKLTSQEQQEKT